MLLVTKLVSSLNVTISDENKLLLKGKLWAVVLLFATNSRSSLKTYNSDEIQVVTKEYVYIYHTFSYFFFHFTIDSLSFNLSLTA